MKKFFALTLLTLTLGTSLTSMTSCTQEMMDQCMKNAGDNYDFNEARRCIKDYCKYDSKRNLYIKYTGSKEDAKDYLRKYTNYKMQIPSTWNVDSKTYIVVTEGTGDVFYNVTFISPDEVTNAVFKRD